MAKNMKMANKGMVFEEEIRLANEAYRRKNIALIQKISTPWKVIRKGQKIVSAFPEGQSTLDFRGTVNNGISISFDCKETQETKGLPLKNIETHQIQYMKNALEVGEISFILCYIKTLNQRFYIDGLTVTQFWDRWQQNKGKRGYNYIPIEVMEEVKSRNGIVLDYLKALKGVS